MDDAGAIQRAIKAIAFAHGGVLSFPPGVYRTSGPIALNGLADFQIEGKGATIRPLGTYRIREGGGHVIIITNCGNFSVSGLSIDANARVRGRRETSHSLILCGCSNFVVEGLQITDAVCDGLYLSAWKPPDPSTACRDGTVRGCTIDGAFRNCVSIIQANHVTIQDSMIRNARGTSPESGIDIESNPDDANGANHDIEIRRNTISSCNVTGVKIVGQRNPHGIVISQNSITGCASGIVEVDATQADETISQNRIEDCTAIAIALSGVRSSCERNALINCHDIGIYAEGSNHSIRGNALVDTGRANPPGSCIHTLYGKGETTIEWNSIRSTVPKPTWIPIVASKEDLLGLNWRQGVSGKDGQF